MHPPIRTAWGRIYENTQWRKVKQMQPLQVPLSLSLTHYLSWVGGPGPSHGAAGTKLGQREDKKQQLDWKSSYCCIDKKGKSSQCAVRQIPADQGLFESRWAMKWCLDVVRLRSSGILILNRSNEWEHDCVRGGGRPGGGQDLPVAGLHQAGDIIAVKPMYVLQQCEPFYKDLCTDFTQPKSMWQSRGTFPDALPAPTICDTYSIDLQVAGRLVVSSQTINNNKILILGSTHCACGTLQVWNTLENPYGDNANVRMMLKVLVMVTI